MISPGRGISSLIPSSTSNLLRLALHLLRCTPENPSWMHPSCRNRVHSERTPYLKVADGKHFTAKRSRLSHVPERDREICHFSREKWQRAFRYRWRYVHASGEIDHSHFFEFGGSSRTRSRRATRTDNWLFDAGN